ncbi:hypothetical protein CARUB_v10014376mg [Capsella rubella]|uniref:TF-B3 domain-containing protein n=1 Tax=Capsella rubella TaxID=81985 RepID=R0I012_9BRAS|nr:B3 domain-containing protein At3g11580 [Capsella rubella]EOA31210.1 hypothetical protein CARUB_v10014376mg [Capsella rubella]
MSVNHYHHHNTLSLQQHQQHIHHQNDLSLAQRESLFEKSLTPSDVGKLNRLVIPKQHAEKYFALSNNNNNGGGGGGDDVATTEKGMLLSFEDESGKCWKFRYSYWNSSQSYVLTKGWSRYVKDKHLDAGDVVFFQRHRFDLQRLFIGWRRRGEASSSPGAVSQEALAANTTAFWTPYRQVHASTTYPNIHHEYSHYGAAADQAQSTPTVVAGSSRTVRLFGVNLECHGDAVEPPPRTDGGYSGQHIFYYSTPHPMDISFAGEALEQVGDGRG